MQTVTSRIWTCIVVSNPYDGNYNTSNAFIYIYIYIYIEREREREGEAVKEKEWVSTSDSGFDVCPLPNSLSRSLSFTGRGSFEVVNDVTSLVTTHTFRNVFFYKYTFSFSYTITTTTTLILQITVTRIGSQPKHAFTHTYQLNHPLQHWFPFNWNNCIFPTHAWIRFEFR